VVLQHRSETALPSIVSVTRRTTEEDILTRKGTLTGAFSVIQLNAARHIGSREVIYSNASALQLQTARSQLILVLGTE